MNYHSSSRNIWRLKHYLPSVCGTALALTVFSPAAFAAAITWDAGPSGTGTDWATAANWSGDVAPADNITADSASFNSVTTGQPAVGSARSITGIDFANTSGGWTLSGAGPLTLGNKGIDATAWISGNNTVSVASIVMGSASDAVWSIFISTSGNAATSQLDVSSGIQVNSAATLDFFCNRNGTSGGVGTINLSGVISGTISTTGKRVGFRGNGASSSRNTINITGPNTYTAPTLIQAVNLNFNSLANAGSASSFGSSGNITLVDNTSFASMNYTGSGPGATDRLLTVAGTASATINNNGSGPISFNNTGNLASGTAGVRSLTLGGTYTAAANTFAETINDLGTSPNITSVTKSGAGTWILSGANTYSGTTTISGGTLSIGAANNLGAATATTFLNFTGSAVLQTTAGLTLASAGTIAIGNTYTATFDNTAAAGAGSTFEISAKITGAGAVKRASRSSSLNGAIRFSNDASDYTGSFSQGFGLTEFTSVANGGAASALGAASTAYAIGNSASAANLRYVGSVNTSTTRPIDWQATEGGLTLDNTGSGTVQYLATGNLKSGIGSSGLTLQGSNAGNNTLAQAINDSGGTTTVTKSGTGRWILSGVNTYGGTTSISGGNLSVSSDANLGTTPGVPTLGNIIISGGALSVSASFTLNANRGIALGPTSGSGGGTVDVAGGQTLTYAGIIANNGAGNGSLGKTSGGTLLVSGVNTYSGGTTINLGTLEIGATGSIKSNVTVNGGLLKLDNASALQSTGNLTLPGAPSGNVSLSFVGTQSVNALYFGAAQQDQGTWGAVGSGAEHEHAAFTGTGILQVNTGNHTPVAKSFSLSAAGGTSVLTQIIGGKPAMAPTDADNDTVVVNGVDVAAHGTVTTDGASITYTAANDYSGGDSFTYTVSDGHSTSAPATVTVTVAAGGGVSPNVISGPTYANGKFTVTFAGIPGFAYTVEYAQGSAVPPWSKLVNLSADSNGLIIVEDAASQSPGRYYRIVYPSY